MVRWEVRFYDGPSAVIVALEIPAVDRHAAERAAILYMEELCSGHGARKSLRVAVIRELA